MHSESVCVADDERLEQVVVRVSLQNYDIIVCSIYLHPNSELALYKQHAACIQQLLDVTDDRSAVLVIGDNNLPHLCWVLDEDLNLWIPANASSEQEITLIESFVTYVLSQENYLTNVNGRLLDLAFIDNNNFADLLEPPLPLLRVDQHHKPFVLKFEIN